MANVVRCPSYYLGNMLIGYLLFLAFAVTGSAAETGLRKEVIVKKPTRLDWAFAAASFGPRAATLPKDYDSGKQKYLLYVPKKYQAKKTWPLVVFISPSDDPAGWNSWKSICEKQDLLFCAPYGAGNACPVGKRTRIVLDMLDDVRRQYRIDPDQTYLTGFSGGGRMACTIAFALPEYLGGVIPICGTNPLHHFTFLRHRVVDRLSVAFVTGEKDFNRKESDQYMAPYFKDLKVRSKLWVVSDMGHAIPPSAVIAEVHEWLAEDLKRRRADSKSNPGLVVRADKELDANARAAKLLEGGEALLKKDGTLWRGVALLQGALFRWPQSEAGKKAKEILEGLRDDPAKIQLISQQGGAEEQLMLAAQAKALEKFPLRGRAIKIWELPAKNHPNSPAGKKALQEIKRLKAELDKEPKKPLLGITFKEQSTTVATLIAKGPSETSGIQAGDIILKLGKVKVANFMDVGKALQKYKPGDSIDIEIDRDGKNLSVTVKLGTRPIEE